MTYSPPPATTQIILPTAQTMGDSAEPSARAATSELLTPSHVVWPRHVYAPLVDVGLTAPFGPYPQFDMVTMARTLGVRFFQIGHVTGDQNGRPVVAGYRLGSPWDQGLRRQIAELRNRGGDVALSFGGVNGADAELACRMTDIARLADTYAEVINAYGVRRVDFDLQESAVADTASVDIRCRAIARLQVAQAALGRPVDVWFSLAAQDGGLGAPELEVLQAALTAGVEIAGVNLHAMNFLSAETRAGRQSSAVAAATGLSLGERVIGAAERACVQLRSIFERPRRHLTDAQLHTRIGITPMIGQNEMLTQQFSTADALRVAEWARARGFGQLSMWSLNRDAMTGRANYDSTGIAQQPFEFTRIFAQFSGRA